MDPVMLLLILVGIVGFSLLVGAGRPRADLRSRRRWEPAFYAEAHQEVQTDPTGALMSSLRGVGLGAGQSLSSCGAVL